MTPALKIVLLNGGYLRPALDLQYTSDSVDSRVTYSGGAGGTRINAAGVIEAKVCPRIDFDPVTHFPKGMLAEESRTNMLLNSTIDGANLATQSVTTTAQAYTLSFYGTGTVTLSGTATGSKVGTGAYPTRSTFTFTPTAGTLTLTVAGTVQYAQLEAGSFATSYIPTAGAQVTRTADSATMTGTNFSSWFNNIQGTILIEADAYISPGNYGTYSLNDGGTNNRIYGNVDFSAYQWVVVNGGVTQATLPTGTFSANTLFKHAAAYAANDFAACVNGSAVGLDNSGVVPIVNQLYIGNTGGTANFLNGHVKRFRCWRTRLPNATLQSFTT